MFFQECFVAVLYMFTKLWNYMYSDSVLYIYLTPAPAFSGV